MRMQMKTCNPHKASGCSDYLMRILNKKTILSKNSTKINRYIYDFHHKASNYFCDFCGRVQSHDSGLPKQFLGNAINY